MTPRTVLFYRNFRKFRGGHLKVWDYFNHVLAAAEFTPRIFFSPRSSWDDTNPWGSTLDYVVDSWSDVHPDVFFVAGRDWGMVDEHPDAGPDIPVINLIQHVRHADPNSTRFQFLTRKAIRICVSEEVRQALEGTGLTQGPLVVIPNGLDLEPLLVTDGVEQDVEVVVVALKRPEIGEELEARLRRPDRRVEVLSGHLSRSHFLERIRRARTTVFLPNETEGFYLPALEGMALGTLVVCPDCIGNRSFCIPGVNAFRPAFRFEDLVHDTEIALTLEEPAAGALRRGASETVANYSLDAERQRFHDVLADFDALWAGS